MEPIATRFFDSIARTIYSLGLVTFVMLFVIASMIFFSHTLFLSVFPVSMASWEKQAAASLMAVGWELTVLVTTCNPKHINRSIPWIIALASACIVLFFIQAFDFTQDPLIVVQRWFVGVLAGTINFIYARLFHRKWSERNELIELPIRLNQAERRADELQSKLDEASRAVAERDTALNEARSALKERDRDFKQLESKLREFERELTCPHCGVVQSNPRSLNAHKGHCEQNPINKNNGSPKLLAHEGN
jgi:hypothetical protein